MAILGMLPFLVIGLATVVSASPVEGMSLEPRANTWEAHAKYYALGGGTGNEIYIQGTWSNPAKTVGHDSGPCSARIGGLSNNAPFDINCSCQITADGPLRFTSTCFLDFAEESGSGWAAGFSVAFSCTAFGSCTGSSAYSVSSSQSKCTAESGNPCNGFKVTP
ncbi:hypothetical protein GQ44DRAFT_832274 [Phaeosphaeriaceae sp. PMI808]|nr:hypothetical protein GQ44DRAFT_832274 [Phaeosphaeriaceae sp. PMI808]